MTDHTETEAETITRLQRELGEWRITATRYNAQLNDLLEVEFNPTMDGPLAKKYLAGMRTAQGERDRARNIAARLEQENAELERRLTERSNHA